ncbi:sulfatase-like hydrolase/transferase [Leucobacter sp. CSA1]|uniref:Sulfatase-like hydrolase/transferase n=1 Tax=Leucobacter chromiisoli TaxID=2796471 RepID=A0A934USU3_9MICO|nr:sulfatase-like hydrolase/transferase [Leucobacter chromiisoli]MBK0417664.1 sulfatase-like hydrolase/transferase [Leucobacter chromiisoli]
MQQETEPGVPVVQVETRRAPAMRFLGAVWAVLGWLLVALGAVLFGSALWIRQTFGPISVDQMLMHLPGAGGGDAEATPEGYLSSFVVQALVIPLAAVGALLSLALLVRRRPKRDRRSYAVPPRPSRAALLWRRIRARHWARPVLAVAACVAGGAVFAQAVQAPQYVQSITTPMTLEDYYVAPEAGGAVSTVGDPRSGEERKNLVLIYLESMEDAFSDAELMGENLLEPVEEATEGWGTIPALRQYEGGGWTMSGIVGSQCGVPLRGAGYTPRERNDIGEGEDDYLPGAVCLGDVLDGAGYTSVFMGGAHEQFASKGVYLRNHGYDTVKDANHWIAQGETEYSVWGLSDARLMENAKAEVDELHASGRPFNLTLLTLDSHEPAHLFDHCPQTTEEPLSSAIKCSMSEVAGFVEHMESQGYLDDTVVVLVGDHEKMVGEDRPYWSELGDLQGRTIFNRIWSPDGVGDLRSVDQLSLYPTLLDLLDLGRPDHRAGVGVSALVDETASTSILDLSPDEYREVVNSRSFELYQRLWGLEGPGGGGTDRPAEAGERAGSQPVEE